MARSWDDDEAIPLRFLLCALACILIPWTGVLLWWLRDPGRSKVARAFPDVSPAGHRVRHCQTSAMVSKRAYEMQLLKSLWHACTTSLIFQIVLLSLLWVWSVSVALQLRTALAQNALYEGFDPYSILGVDASTGEAELNKAFRRVALKHHPDKNPENPKAAEIKFLLARKALDSLIEPEAMSNFKKYGNPDGPQFVKLFAVSSFIKDKDASRENGKLTYKQHWFRAADLQIQLGVALFCLIGGPFLLWTIFSFFEGDTGSYRNVLSVGTIDALTEGLKSVTDIVSARNLLLENAEKRKWCRKRFNVEVLEALQQESMQCSRSRAAILFFAHVRRRHAVLDKTLTQELVKFLNHAHCISQAMVELATEVASAQTVVAAIDLQQCLVQALDPDDVSSDSWPANQLLQAPHLDEESIGIFLAGQGGTKPKLVGGLRGFLEQSAADRKARMCHLDQQALSDIEEFAAVAPCMEICTATVAACSGEGIRDGCRARLHAVLRRKNLGKCEAVGSAHAPLFPLAAVPETWWLILELPDGASTACHRLMDTGRDLVGDIEFEVPMAGKCKCKLRAMCEVYAGLDVERQIVFTALD